MSPFSALLELATPRGPLRTSVLRPAGTPTGGVVLVHDAFGPSEHLEELAERLAFEGFAVAAPDLYSRVGRPDVSDLSDVRAKNRGIPDRVAVADLVSCVEFLEASGVSRTASLGFSAGGRLALLHACSDRPPAAAIVCWAGLMESADYDQERTPNRPVPVIEVLDALGCPLLLIGAAEDRDPNPATIARVHSRLVAAGKDVDVKVFGGVGHAFLDPRLRNYDDAQARRCWELIVATLHRVLESPELPNSNLQGG